MADKEYRFPPFPNLEKPKLNINPLEEVLNTARNEATQAGKAALFLATNRKPNFFPTGGESGKRLSANSSDFISVESDKAEFDIENAVILSFLPTDYFNKSGQIERSEQIDFKVATLDVTKTIRSVDTGLLNQNGFITEVTGVDGYNISITVVLYDNLSTKPDKLLNDVEKLLLTSAPINVFSPFLEGRGIQQIMVKSYSIPMMSEKKNYYTVSINAISVSPDLFILEDF